MQLTSNLTPQRTSRKRHPLTPGDAPFRLSSALAGNVPRHDHPLLAAKETLASNTQGNPAIASRDAVKALPSSWRYWNNLGAALRKAGRYGEARTAFREAWKLAPPQDTRPALNLAYVEMECGRHQHAWDIFQMVLRRSPELAEVRIRAARACYELDEKRLAKQLIEDWPHWQLDDNMLAELVALMLQLGRMREGMALLDEIYDVSRVNPYSRVCLATALEQRGCLKKARDCVASLPPPEHIHGPLLREEILTLNASLAWRAGNLAGARRLLGFLDAPPFPGINRNARPYILLADVCYQQSDMMAAQCALAKARSALMKAADIACLGGNHHQGETRATDGAWAAQPSAAGALP